MVASALYDVATALPVSAHEIRQLDPGLTVTDYAHAGTILEQVQRRFRSARRCDRLALACYARPRSNGQWNGPQLLVKALS